MKRTKQWWATLEPQERQVLVMLQRNIKESYLSSDDHWICGGCGTNRIASADIPCPLCSKRLAELIDKAEKGAGS